MADTKDRRVEPVAVVLGPGHLQAIRAAQPGSGRPTLSPVVDAQETQTPAAATGGSLRPSYAEFAIDGNTHQVVIRIRDASTDRVLHEYPSAEVQRMSRHLKDYADRLARHRLASPPSGAA